MSRAIKDALLKTVKALPAAAASASQTAIDLGAVTPDVSLQNVEALLSVPATPSLVDTKTITYTFEDSADNSSFAAIAELATKVSTGAGGTGAAAVSHRVKLPPATRRYLRVTAAVLTAGGDNTAISFTLELLF